MRYLDDVLKKAKMELSLREKEGRMAEADCWKQLVGFLRREISLVSGMEKRKERISGSIQEPGGYKSENQTDSCVTKVYGDQPVL